jgi:hypothetical protein
MPTKSAIKAKKAGASKPAAKRKPAASAGRAATAKATENKSSAGKREAAAAQDTKNMATVVKMRGQNKPWSEIAEAISTTPGKAQFLMMKHRVAEGEVPTISQNGKPEQVTARLVKARNSADEFSSWGWLSARSGLSEGVIKNMLAEAGSYTPREVNIAAQRAAANGGGAAAKTTTASTAKPKAKPKPKAGTAAAKAKAKARTKRSNPSK